MSEIPSKRALHDKERRALAKLVGKCVRCFFNDAHVESGGFANVHNKKRHAMCFKCLSEIRRNSMEMKNKRLTNNQNHQDLRRESDEAKISQAIAYMRSLRGE